MRDIQVVLMVLTRSGLAFQPEAVEWSSCKVSDISHGSSTYFKYIFFAFRICIVFLLLFLLRHCSTFHKNSKQWIQLRIRFYENMQQLLEALTSRIFALYFQIEYETLERNSIRLQNIFNSCHICSVHYQSAIKVMFLD